MLHPSIYALLATGVLTIIPALASPRAFQVTPPPPVEQSQNDLRAENDRLSKQVAALQGDLNAALARVKLLEDQLAQAKKEAAAGGSGSGTDATPTAAPNAPPPESVPANPAIGPGGLLSKLIFDYGNAFGQADVPSSATGTDPISRQAWTLHQHALESWIAREQKGVVDVQWIGTIDPASVQQNGREVRMVVDFVNGGRHFPTPILVDQGIAARLTGPDGLITTAPVAVSAIVTPRLRVNPARPTAGAFDNPPLIGPFLEFGYDIKPKVLLPADKARPLTGKP